MGQHHGKREPLVDKTPSAGHETDTASTQAEQMDDNEVFRSQGEADASLNNGNPSQGTAATDSTGTGNASAADPNSTRPHLVRLFSRDAPGRRDNTFKDRPSESDELHTISECGAELAERDAE